MAERQTDTLSHDDERQERDAPAPAAALRADTGTLGKAVHVLEVIATASTPMRFTDVLNAVDQPRGTLHRQISNLIEEGLVETGPDHTYLPGLRLLKLAARAWSLNSIRSIAQPHIERLHRETGETVHLGQMLETEVIYLDKIESNQSVRMHSQVGKASPLHCTGIGKAMLARLPREEATARIARMSLTKYTETTLITAAALEAELDDIRTTGISHDREEHETGIRCVAASVATPDGRTIAGVSVTAPSFRVDEATIDKWIGLVRATARAIEDDLAAGIGPRHGA